MAVEKEEKMTTATVDIHVVEGKDLVAMDRNGFSDPYVVVECGNAKATKRTKVISKTLNPQWNEQLFFEVEYPPPPYIYLRLWDKDQIGKDDRMGMVVIPFTSVWASSECEMEGWFDVAKVQPKDSATGKLFVRVKYEGPIPQAVAVASSAAREASPAAATTTEPVEAAPTAGNEELERLTAELAATKKELEDLRASHAALQKRCEGLEQNLVNAKLPTVESAPSEEQGYTAEQRYIAQLAFEKYDVDGNGSIDRYELRQILNELRKNKVLNMSDKLFERYVDMNWRKIDADNSGSIDFEEFLEFLYSKSGDFGNVSLQLRSSEVITRLPKEKR